MFKAVTNITAAEFEHQVKAFLEAGAGDLQEFRTEHKECIEGADGAYEIDVTARFRALGADFLVLVECKHHIRPVKREHVQVLHAKMTALGAQKAMVFSTAGFQDGSIQYALQHGIALVQIALGETSYFARSANPPRLPEWLPPFVGWWIERRDEASGGISYSLLAPRYSRALKKFLFDGREPLR